MRTEVGDWIVGPSVAIFGLIGLVMFGRAEDAEMSVFGASLAAFAIVFVFGMIRRAHGRANVVHGHAEGEANG